MSSGMKVILPMAGGDEAFRKAGFPFAKPLIEIAGRPLFEHAFAPLRAIPGARFVFVIRKEDDLRFHLGEVLRLIDPAGRVIRAEGETAGAACTALLAVEAIDPEEELLIANADQILDFDVAATIARLRGRGLDAGTVVFDSVHPRWSFVKTDAEGLVIEAAEKRPISRNATAGVYWYRQGRFFVEAAKAMIAKGASVNGGFFVCPTFNELILAQRRIGVERIERGQYVSLASPQAVEEYEKSLAVRA
jgi:NDP-sugar pyrophosphorylase family protein